MKTKILQCLLSFASLYGANLVTYTLLKSDVDLLFSAMSSLLSLGFVMFSAHFLYQVVTKQKA